MINNSEGLLAAVKLTPPLTVGGLTLFGIGLNDAVLIITGLYAVLQIIFLVYDRIVHPHREKRRGRQRSNLKQDS